MKKGTIDFRITNIIENLPYVNGVVLRQDIEIVLDSYKEVIDELNELKAKYEQAEIVIRRQEEENKRLNWLIERQNHTLKSQSIYIDKHKLDH